MVNTVNITAGVFHDRHGIQTLTELVTGSLVLFDLGYQDYGLFAEIRTNEGFFLSRLKCSANIIANAFVLFPEWIRKNILDINYFLGPIIEFHGNFEIASNVMESYRVIGFWNITTKKYHWYCTNLKKNVHFKFIYDLYRVR